MNILFNGAEFPYKYRCKEETRWRCPSSIGVSTFLYADDILLIAPSVCALQTLLDACEEELRCLDMQINTKKSVCIRTNARYNTEILLHSHAVSISWCICIQWRHQDLGPGGHSPPLPFPSLHSPFLPSSPLPSPPLEVGPLNPARGSGGAL